MNYPNNPKIINATVMNGEFFFGIEYKKEFVNGNVPVPIRVEYNNK